MSGAHLAAADGGGGVAGLPVVAGGVPRRGRRGRGGHPLARGVALPATLPVCWGRPVGAANTPMGEGQTYSRTRERRFWAAPMMSEGDEESSSTRPLNVVAASTALDHVPTDTP